MFYEAFIPPPRMIIFGAVDFTAALVKVANVLGYRVTVCDARPPFATKERFPLQTAHTPTREAARMESRLYPNTLKAKVERTSGIRNRPQYRQSRARPQNDRRTDATNARLKGTAFKCPFFTARNSRAMTPPAVRASQRKTKP